jgi:pimeloyl-ACP methyl ester carboxylesterase
MTTKTLHQVSVPGATLHCEVSGNGPFLLLVPGGGTDAAAFDGILPQLAEHYTVVSYDPRGSARSPYAGAPADDRIDQVAEDALAVLNSVGAVEPAYVFGSSNGAITALELLVRHPDRIRLLVAHEPPAMGLLPDATSALEFFHDVHDTYQRSGRTLSEQQGWSVVTFPGGHVGYLTDPFEFATLLLQVLAGKVAR